MANRIYISPECGDNCHVIFPELLSGRAAEVYMCPRHPIHQPQIADMWWPNLQDGADHIENRVVCRIELEERQPGRAILNQDDDGIVVGHSLHRAFGVIRFDAQQGAGLRRIDQVDTSQKACLDTAFVEEICRWHLISPWERLGFAPHRSSIREEA